MHAIIGFDFCIEMFNLVSHLFLPFLPSGFLHNPLSFPQVPVLFVETQILEAVLVGPAGGEQLLRISLNLPMVKYCNPTKGPCVAPNNLMSEIENPLIRLAIRQIKAPNNLVELNSGVLSAKRN